MKRFQKLLKICLTGGSSLLISCSQLPEFPDWNPESVIFSESKAFKCKLVDKVNIVFECEKTSHSMSEIQDGSFCSSPEETINIINWVKEAKSVYEKNCGPK